LQALAAGEGGHHGKGEDGGQGVAPSFAGARVGDAGQFLHQRQGLGHECLLLRFNREETYPPRPLSPSPTRKQPWNFGRERLTARVRPATLTAARAGTPAWSG